MLSPAAAKQQARRITPYKNVTSCPKFKSRSLNYQCYCYCMSCVTKLYYGICIAHCDWEHRTAGILRFQNSRSVEKLVGSGPDWPDQLRRARYLSSWVSRRSAIASNWTLATCHTPLPCPRSIGTRKTNLRAISFTRSNRLADPRLNCSKALCLRLSLAIATQ